MRPQNTPQRTHVHVRVRSRTRNGDPTPMRTFLKYAAVFAAGLFAQRVTRMGWEKLDKALEGIDDATGIGVTNRAPAESKKD